MINVRALGILGGTFDPIHYGHLITAEYAYHELGLDKVLVIPAANPPHKDSNEVLAGQHRYHMAEMAIKDNAIMEISPVEMRRTGYSYTVETVEYYQIEYPHAQIFFIVGADALLTMDTWKDIGRLGQMCRFIVATRPGYHIDRYDPALAKLPAYLLDTMIQLQIPALDISSSDIRRRAAEGKPIKYLLPPQVEDYILSHGLYQGKGEGNAK